MATGILYLYEYNEEARADDPLLCCSVLCCQLLLLRPETLNPKP